MNIKSYQEYLNTRSQLALIYRNFFLYPILEKNLKKPCLDVGSGIGDFIKFSKKTSHGVEVNKFLVDQCVSSDLNVKLIVEDKIPFRSNSFNSAILDNVLEHICKPNQILIEINRILNKDSILIIGVPGLKGYKSDSDHKIFYSDRNLLPLIIEKGFELKKKLLLPIPINFLSNFLRIQCYYYIFHKK